MLSLQQQRRQPRLTLVSKWWISNGNYPGVPGAIREDTNAAEIFRKASRPYVGYSISYFMYPDASGQEPFSRPYRRWFKQSLATYWVNRGYSTTFGSFLTRYYLIWSKTESRFIITKSPLINGYSFDAHQLYNTRSQVKNAFNLLRSRTRCKW